jgi:hypothetical protein
LCAAAGANVAAAGGAPAWGVEFPYGSAAHIRHWEDREVAIPAELLTASRDTMMPIPVGQMQLNMSVEKLQAPQAAYQRAADKFKELNSSGASEEELAKARKAAEDAKRALEKQAAEIRQLAYAQQFPSRVNPNRETTVTELQDVANALHSRTVHPAQLYASGAALLLSLFLSALFYRRKRHGVVIAALLILYPIQRMLLEIIRSDNPHEVAGLTISQSLSLGLFLFGLGLLIVLYTRFPERSPLADEVHDNKVEPVPA